MSGGHYAMEEGCGTEPPPFPEKVLDYWLDKPKNKAKPARKKDQEPIPEEEHQRRWRQGARTGIFAEFERRASIAREPPGKANAFFHAMGAAGEVFGRFPDEASTMRAELEGMASSFDITSVEKQADNAWKAGLANPRTAPDRDRVPSRSITNAEDAVALIERWCEWVQHDPMVTEVFGRCRAATVRRMLNGLGLVALAATKVDFACSTRQLARSAGMNERTVRNYVEHFRRQLGHWAETVSKGDRFNGVPIRWRLRTPLSPMDTNNATGDLSNLEKRSIKPSGRLDAQGEMWTPSWGFDGPKVESSIISTTPVDARDRVLPPDPDCPGDLREIVPTTKLDPACNEWVRRPGWWLAWCLIAEHPEDGMSVPELCRATNRTTKTVRKVLGFFVQEGSVRAQGVPYVDGTGKVHWDWRYFPVVNANVPRMTDVDHGAKRTARHQAQADAFHLFQRDNADEKAKLRAMSPAQRAEYMTREARVKRIRQLRDVKLADRVPPADDNEWLWDDDGYYEDEDFDA